MSKWIATIGVALSVGMLAIFIGFAVNVVMAGVLLFTVDLFLGTTYCTWQYVVCTGAVITVLKMIFGRSDVIK